MIAIDEIPFFHLTQFPLISASKRIFMKGFLVAAATITSTEAMKSKSKVNDPQRVPKTILTHGISFFGDNQQTNQLQLLIRQNAEFWEERINLAKVPKDEKNNRSVRWLGKQTQAQLRKGVLGKQRKLSTY